MRNSDERVRQKVKAAAKVDADIEARRIAAKNAYHEAHPARSETEKRNALVSVLQSHRSRFGHFDFMLHTMRQDALARGWLRDGKLTPEGERECAS